MTGAWALEQRRINAEKRFVSYAMETAKVSEEDARKILVLYKKHKLIKIDVVVGQFSFAHGDFANAWCLTNSLKKLK